MVFQRARKIRDVPRRKNGSTKPKKLAVVPAASEREQPKAPKLAGHRFVIREVAPKDLDTLHTLSRHLNSVNLPNQRELLKRIIQCSVASFSGKLADPFRREYLFVLEDESTGEIAGTSMLFAQHGHPDTPHVYFDVINDERYSITLDRHFSHLCLRLGFNYRGPTEVGGLVLDPAFRSLGLGRVLSYVRFLYIAMFRQRFRPSVIAELMPPLLDDGRSELWEYLGRPFTGLDYQEADKLSKTNKEFITALFPQTPLYASLLPPHVQALIGQVGDEARGVKRMLEAVGFTYSERIDPFDGGPHFEAQTDEITLVREARQLAVHERALTPQELARDDRGVVRALVARGEPNGAAKFRAVMSEMRREGGSVQLTPAALDALRLRAGQTVWTTPLE